MLEKVKERLRLRYYRLRTEEAYPGWIRRFVPFHDQRHPRDMGAEVGATFLSGLAVRGKVSASMQNRALAAVLFLCTGCDAR